MVKNDHRRSALRRKCLSLGLGDLAAVAVFVYAAFGVVAPRLVSAQAGMSFLVGVASLVLVLSQAGAYWLLARTWVQVRPMPRRLARLYRAFQVLDVFVLVVAGAYIAVHLSSTRWAGVLAAAVWLFAVVEFANYYVVRLSYPWGQWLTMVGQWRTPRLIQDLRTADGTSARSGSESRPPNRRGILMRYSWRCSRSASSSSPMTGAGTCPRTGPIRSTVTERTCSA